MSKNVFLRLWDYLKHYQSTLYLAVFLKIVAAVASVIEPFILGLMVTELTSSLMAGRPIDGQKILFLIIVYIIRGLLSEIGSYGSNFFMTRTVQRSIHDLRHDLSHKINKIPVSYFDKHKFGDMLGRFTSDVETVSNALQQSFLQVINEVLTLIMVVAMVLYLNLQLGLFVIATIPITYFSASYLLKKSQPYFKRQADVLGDMNGFVQENLTGFNVIKLYGRE